MIKLSKGVVSNGVTGKRVVIQGSDWKGVSWVACNGQWFFADFLNRCHHPLALPHVHMHMGKWGGGLCRTKQYEDHSSLVQMPLRGLTLGIVLLKAKSQHQFHHHP